MRDERQWGHQERPGETNEIRWQTGEALPLTPTVEPSAPEPSPTSRDRAVRERMGEVLRVGEEDRRVAEAQQRQVDREIILANASIRMKELDKEIEELRQATVQLSKRYEEYGKVLIAQMKEETERIKAEVDRDDRLEAHRVREVEQRLKARVDETKVIADLVKRVVEVGDSERTDLDREIDAVFSHVIRIEEQRRQMPSPKDEWGNLDDGRADEVWQLARELSTELVRARVQSAKKDLAR